MVGMPSCDAVLDEDGNEQLRRRFSIRDSLAPFGWKNKVQRRDFRVFLDELDELLPLLECSHLADFNTAFLIHEATGGTIAYVMKLIRRAAALAIEQGAEKIDFEFMAQAYEERLAVNHPTKPNPFRVTAIHSKQKRTESKPLVRRTTNRRVKAREKEETSSEVLKQR